jgi:hypothetical protein
MKSKLVLAEEEEEEEEMVLLKYSFRPTSLDSTPSGELVVDDVKAVTLNCQNREFSGHIEQYDGTSYVNCVVAGTANGEVKLFKVKNKVNLKLHNSSSLPASSSAPVTDIVSASQIAPKDSDKFKKTKKKKEDIAAIMKKRIKY